MRPPNVRTYMCRQERGHLSNVLCAGRNVRFTTRSRDMEAFHDMDDTECFVTVKIFRYDALSTTSDDYRRRGRAIT